MSGFYNYKIRFFFSFLSQFSFQSVGLVWDKFMLLYTFTFLHGGIRLQIVFTYLAYFLGFLRKHYLHCFLSQNHKPACVQLSVIRTIIHLVRETEGSTVGSAKTNRKQLTVAKSFLFGIWMFKTSPSLSVCLCRALGFNPPGWPVPQRPASGTRSLSRDLIMRVNAPNHQ